jgi:hypothetical protein
MTMHQTTKEKQPSLLDWECFFISLRVFVVFWQSVCGFCHICNFFFFFFCQLLLECGFRSKFSRTSWKLHGFCLFFRKCRIFMISFHFVVRTLHKLQLLGLADKPRKKGKSGCCCCCLLGYPAALIFILLPLLSVLVVWFRLFVLRFVAFLVQGGATQLWIARITFIMFLFCWEKSWSDSVVLWATGLLDPKLVGNLVGGRTVFFFLSVMTESNLVEGKPVAASSYYSRKSTLLTQGRLGSSSWSFSNPKAAAWNIQLFFNSCVLCA